MLFKLHCYRCTNTATFAGKKPNLTFSGKVDLLSKAVLNLIFVARFPIGYHCVKHVTLYII